MLTKTKGKLLIAGSLAALVAGGSAWAQADTQKDTSAAAPTTCDGGVQKRSLSRTETIPVQAGESLVYSQVPGGAYTRTFTTAADQVRIQFSAEASLFGAQANNTGTDALGIDISLDGVRLPAVGDLAFALRPFEAHSVTVCRRVASGTHTVSVLWRVIDGGANNNVTARLDDATLDIQISE